MWDRDVVEAFIGSDPGRLRPYTEYEVAPTNEKLDLILNKPQADASDFNWDSHFQTATKVDKERKVWTSEWRIPLKSLAEIKPGPGARWRINFYRCDRANHASLAWSPTLNQTFHVPEKFGTLEFTE